MVPHLSPISQLQSSPLQRNSQSISSIYCSCEHSLHRYVIDSRWHHIRQDKVIKQLEEQANPPIGPHLEYTCYMPCRLWHSVLQSAGLLVGYAVTYLGFLFGFQCPFWTIQTTRSSLNGGPSRVQYGERFWRTTNGNNLVHSSRIWGITIGMLILTADIPSMVLFLYAANALLRAKWILDTKG